MGRLLQAPGFVARVRSWLGKSRTRFSVTDDAYRDQMQRIGSRMKGLNRDLASGKITVEEWADDFDKLLFDGHRISIEMGRDRAGAAALGDQELFEKVRAVKDSQQERLQDFIQAVRDPDNALYRDADGNLKRARMDWRSDLYVGRMRGTANAAFVDGSEDGDEFDWILGGNEDHCDDCPRLAAQSPFTKNNLPAAPGEGDTECLGNCDCELERKDGVRGFPRVHLGSSAPAVEGSPDEMPAPLGSGLQPLLKLDPSGKYLNVKPDLCQEELERQILPLDHEVAAVYDPAGKLAFAPRVGGGESVGFNDAERGLMENATLTHNHPHGSCLSPVDFRTAAIRNLAQIRAVGRYGIFCAKRPAQGWPDADIIYRTATQAFNRAIRDRDREVSAWRTTGLPVTNERVDELFSRLSYNSIKEAFARIGVTVSEE